jgi:hypothetical protein
MGKCAGHEVASLSVTFLALLILTEPVSFFSSALWQALRAKAEAPSAVDVIKSLQVSSFHL